MVSLNFFFLTLYSPSWPWSSTMLVKTSEPSPQSLLCGAVAGSMFGSNRCACYLCDELLASPLPLSTPLQTEVLFLNFASLQIQLTLSKCLLYCILTAHSSFCMLDISLVLAGISKM
jgi:hypothetical protein